MSVWAGVVIYQLHPGNRARATAIWKERVLPFLSKQRDLKGAYWLVGQEGDRAFSIDLWENDIAASTYESSGLYKKLVDNFGLLLAHPPTRIQCQADEFIMAAIADTTPSTPRPASAVPSKAEGLALKLLETIRSMKAR